jgi:hypothetical protein
MTTNTKLHYTHIIQLDTLLADSDALVSYYENSKERRSESGDVRLDASIKLRGRSEGSIKMSSGSQNAIPLNTNLSGTLSLDAIDRVVDEKSSSISERGVTRSASTSSVASTIISVVGSGSPGATPSQH